MNNNAIKIGNVTLRFKKIEGDWCVLWIENGKRNENKSYFGCSANSPGSKEDAIATMKDMASRI